MLHPKYISVGDNREDIADWVETKAFLQQSFSFNELQTLFTDNEDFQEGDFSAEETPEYEFVNDVAAIIDDRCSRLGVLYPFAIEGDSLCVKEPLTDTHYVYVFCLVISHLNAKSFLEEDEQLLTNDIRTLFQIAATVAAAGVWQRGESFCLGWPRTDVPKFLDALRTVYGMINSGGVIDTLPSFHKAVKDAGIDVVAWEHYGTTPGLKEYLLGQVATGSDWKEKDVDALSFHRDFFTTQPEKSEYCSRATFVPHIAGKEYPREDRNLYIVSLEAKHDRMIYRNRLVEFAGNAFARITAGESPAGIMNRYEDFQKIRAWIEGLRAPDHTAQNQGQPSAVAQ